jgi:predicted RNA-binding protein
MCESNVFLEKENKEEAVMEDVISIKPHGDELVLTDILGKQIRIKAQIKEINLLDHKVILEK